MISQSNVCLFPGFAATFIRKSYDVRRVDITPLEQRKVTFDTHALVQELEAHGKWYQINNSKENLILSSGTFECCLFPQSASAQWCKMSWQPLEEAGEGEASDGVPYRQLGR